MDQAYQIHTNLPKTDILVVSIFHEGNPAHWSVVVIYPCMHLIISFNFALHPSSCSDVYMNMFYGTQHQIGNLVSLLVTPNKIQLQFAAQIAVFRHAYFLCNSTAIMSRSIPTLTIPPGTPPGICTENIPGPLAFDSQSFPGPRAFDKPRDIQNVYSIYCIGA